MAAKSNKRRRTRTQHDAQTKCEAVLAIWTERRTPSDLCKELNVTWSQLSTWQDRALEAMLEALEPRRGRNAEQPPCLTKSLQKLFTKKGLKQGNDLVNSRLEGRLTSIQATREDKKS